MSKILAEHIRALQLADQQWESFLRLQQKANPHFQLPSPPTFILDKNLNVLYANVTYRMLYEKKFGSFLNLSTNPKELLLGTPFHSEKPYTFTNQLELPCLGERTFECVITPLFDENRRVSGTIATATDVTNQLAAEKEKNHQKQLYENLLYQFPYIIVRHDRNHRYIFANPALESVTGIAPEEILGKSFDNLGFPEQTWKFWRDRCEDVFASGQPLSFNTEFTSPKGLVQVNTFLLPEAGMDSQVETILAISRLGPRQLEKITAELKKANEELEKQKQYFASIIENIPMIISRFDKNLRHIYVNPASEKLCGTKDDQCLGKTWGEMGMEPKVYSSFQKYYEEALRTGQPVEFETSFPNTQGETSYFQTLVIPERDSWGQVQTLLSIAQDISAKKQLEKEMSRLDRLNVVGEMAASIGHEIRNPLTTVRGYLQLFQKDKELLRYRDQLEMMIGELDRANFIISEFLSLAKNKALQFNLGDVNTIINSILPLIQADAFRFGHNLQIEMQPLPQINLDEKELRQLLLNLTRNAFEAMSTKGTLTVKSLCEEGRVTIEVCDTGPGIAKPILDKLGTPFLTTKETGIGLGLAVCYRIADRHGAKLDVKTSSKGTTFSLIFKDTPPAASAM